MAMLEEEGAKIALPMEAVEALHEIC